MATRKSVYPKAARSWAQARVEQLQRELEAIATAERAEHERAYLKSELVHLGVAQPGIRATARELCREFPEPEPAQLRALLDLAWATGVHELRSCAIALAERWRRQLGVDDLPMFERWLRDSVTWAHVDWLAVKVVGAIVVAAEHDAQVGETLDRWSVDDDFWLRRASMLALLDPLRDADGGDFARFERYASAMLDESEFFIRKAIGWILREAGRKNPARTRKFLKRHLARMSGLSVREAIKCLPADEAAELLARHAEVAPRKHGRKRG